MVSCAAGQVSHQFCPHTEPPAVNDHLFYFRPGEEARMLARCQFGLTRDGKCSATMTYPIRGYPWRRTPVHSYEFQLTAEDATELFEEVAVMRDRYPDQCLDNEVLWSDQSEKANGITRCGRTGKLCHTLAIYRDRGEAVVYFSMEEDSPALCSSRLYRTVIALIAAHETLKTTKA